MSPVKCQSPSEAPGLSRGIKLAVGRLHCAVQLYWGARGGRSQPFKAEPEVPIYSHKESNGIYFSLEERATPHFSFSKWLCVKFNRKEPNQLSAAEAIKRQRCKRHVEIKLLGFGAVGVFNTCYLNEVNLVSCNGWKIHWLSSELSELSEPELVHTSSICTTCGLGSTTLASHLQPVSEWADCKITRQAW